MNEKEVSLLLNLRSIAYHFKLATGLPIEAVPIHVFELVLEQAVEHVLVQIGLELNGSGFELEYYREEFTSAQIRTVEELGQCIVDEELMPKKDRLAQLAVMETHPMKIIMRPNENTAIVILEVW